jgi:predicted nuclease with TOPRIM domain
LVEATTKQKRREVEGKMSKKVFGGRYTLEQLRQNMVLLQAKEVELPRKWLIQLILLAQEGEANKAEIKRLQQCGNYQENRANKEEYKVVRLKEKLEELRCEYESSVKANRNKIARLQEKLELCREAMNLFADYYTGKNTAVELRECEYCGLIGLNDSPICLDCVAEHMTEALEAIDKGRDGE